MRRQTTSFASACRTLAWPDSGVDVALQDRHVGRRDNRKQLFNLPALSLWYASAKATQGGA